MRILLNIICKVSTEVRELPLIQKIKINKNCVSSVRSLKASRENLFVEFLL